MLLTIPQIKGDKMNKYVAVERRLQQSNLIGNGVEFIAYDIGAIDALERLLCKNVVKLPAHYNEPKIGTGYFYKNLVFVRVENRVWVILKEFEGDYIHISTEDDEFCPEFGHMIREWMA